MHLSQKVHTFDLLTFYIFDIRESILMVLPEMLPRK